MRTLGIDVGRRRIGVAVSDSDGRLATPLAVVERGADPLKALEELARLAAHAVVGRIVVGLPISLDGVERAPADDARASAAALARRTGLPVLLEDERFTTVIAAQRRSERVAPPRRARRRGAGAPRVAQSRGHHRGLGIDADAAAVILQSFLEREVQASTCDAAWDGRTGHPRAAP